MKRVQTAMSEALNQLVLDSFFNIIALWLLKQKDCIELVQVENGFFDPKRAGRGESCVGNILLNNPFFSPLNWRTEKIN